MELETFINGRLALCAVYDCTSQSQWEQVWAAAVSAECGPVCDDSTTEGSIYAYAVLYKWTLPVP